jgi:hypothetical protein
MPYITSDLSAHISVSIFGMNDVEEACGYTPKAKVTIMILLQKPKDKKIKNICSFLSHRMRDLLLH